MLSLLTLPQAALHLLHWTKKLDDPLDAKALEVALTEPLRSDYLRCMLYLRNAIDAGILPALRRPLDRAQEKKLLDGAGVPEEAREQMPRQVETWITLTDLVVFCEREDRVPNDDNYSHSRDALARVTWLLLRKETQIKDSGQVLELLAQLTTDAEEDGFMPRLGGTTLKNCVKEILAAGGAMGRTASNP